jgi:hypothetical protein
MIKKYISLIVFISLVMTSLTGCYDEKEWSEDYDIEYPISTISSVTPMEQSVGGSVTISGTNLDVVSAVHIGTVSCVITSQNSTQIVITISGVVEKDLLSVTNKYDRKFIYDGGFFIPVP